MSNEYKISTLLDIIDLDDDQIDRICAELPSVLKYAKNLSVLIENIGEHLKVPTPTEVLSPLTWIDDGKEDLTVGVSNGDERFQVEIKKATKSER